MQIFASPELPKLYVLKLYSLFSVIDLSMARPTNGQPTITQYMNGGSKEAAPAPAVNGTSNKTVENDKPVDEESKKGRFSWFEIEKVYLPFIFR